MKKSKFSEVEIASAVKQVELGIPVAEVCRKLGITLNTYYVWRRRFGSLAPSEIKRLKQLEEENRRLKAMVADLSLDKQMLQEVLRKMD
jgi:putative transposase